jgi:hypothetical protein
MKNKMIRKIVYSVYMLIINIYYLSQPPQGWKEKNLNCEELFKWIQTRQYPFKSEVKGPIKNDFDKIDLDKDAGLLAKKK